jgi:hypothetical protein
MRPHFRPSHLVIYILVAALVVIPAVWGETLSFDTKEMAYRLHSADNPYVLDEHGIIATTPDFDGLIADVRQGMAKKSSNIDYSINMTAFIAQSPRRLEQVVLGEYSSNCSITPSNFLEEYQLTRSQKHEMEGRSSVLHDTETIWRLYSFLIRMTSIKPQWVVVCGNGANPRWGNSLTLPSVGFQFQTIEEKKGHEYAYYVDRSGVAFFF